MSDEVIARTDPARVLKVEPPALNGDNLKSSTVLRDNLTDAALERARKERFFVSQSTKNVRAMLDEMVLSRLKAHQVSLQHLDEAFEIVVCSGLEQIARNLAADGVEFTSSRIIAKRFSLEENLRAYGRRFSEQAIAHKQWAKRLPRADRKRAFKSIEDSLDGFYALMDALIREFETLARQTVGKP
jgi:hypothetical protein